MKLFHAASLAAVSSSFKHSSSTQAEILSLLKPETIVFEDSFVPKTSQNIKCFGKFLTAAEIQETMTKHLTCIFVLYRTFQKMRFTIQFQRNSFASSTELEENFPCGSWLCPLGESNQGKARVRKSNPFALSMDCGGENSTKLWAFSDPKRGSKRRKFQQLIIIARLFHVSE